MGASGCNCGRRDHCSPSPLLLLPPPLWFVERSAMPGVALGQRTTRATALKNAEASNVD